MLEIINFFTPAPLYDYSEFVPKPQIVLISETDSDGKTVIVEKDINTSINPACSLDYSDFALQRMLETGVSYKALQINPDLRLGFDDEINAFNERLVEMADKLFVEQSN